jgi:hypothetical protein
MSRIAKTSSTCQNYTYQHIQTHRWQPGNSSCRARRGVSFVSLCQHVISGSAAPTERRVMSVACALSHPSVPICHLEAPIISTSALYPCGSQGIPAESILHIAECPGQDQTERGQLTYRQTSGYHPCDRCDSVVLTRGPPGPDTPPRNLRCDCSSPEPDGRPKRYSPFDRISNRPLRRTGRIVTKASGSEISVKKKKDASSPVLGHTRRKPTLIRHLGTGSGPKGTRVAQHFLIWCSLQRHYSCG